MTADKSMGRPLSASATPFVPKQVTQDEEGKGWEEVLKTVRHLIDSSQRVNYKKLEKIEGDLRMMTEVSVHDSQALCYDIDLLSSAVNMLTQKVSTLAPYTAQVQQHLANPQHEDPNNMFSELSSLSSSLEKELGLSLYDEDEASNELLISFTHDSDTEQQQQQPPQEPEMSLLFNIGN